MFVPTRAVWGLSWTAGLGGVGGDGGDWLFSVGLRFGRGLWGVGC